VTWARLDDETSTKASWVGLTDVAQLAARAEMPSGLPHEVAERARVLARNAKAVHLLSLMWAVPALSDGRLTPAGVDQICLRGSLLPAEWYEAAELLVASGAWKRINPTKKDPLGGYQMILGWGPGEQPLRADEEFRKKMQRLRDAMREGHKDYPNKLAAIERAGGLCEYCDKPIDTAGEIDHVDPWLFTNDVANLAHACQGCNRKKGRQHRLEDVRMSFTQRAVTVRQQWSNVGPGLDTVSPRVGSGRVGSGKGKGRVGRGAVGQAGAALTVVPDDHFSGEDER
jgi:hypothetical protein